ncbi:unnamed protein product [Citrullus colocynthis]|uniref:Transducin/WD40 repeat-like superfamily protein n=1 Tax=Citrullus colocynthis TaxID=252529 RepID=A0ABP0ZB60_9ROSI
MIKIVLEDFSIRSDDEVNEEDMDVEDTGDEEIANALAVAQTLGKSSETTKSKTKYDDLAEGLKELNMDRYDDEDDGSSHSMESVRSKNPFHSGYKWLVTTDMESLAWDPRTGHMFVVSLEDGTVKDFYIWNATTETSSESKASFTLHAHQKVVCSVSYNPLAPNLLATGSKDKVVWDTLSDAAVSQKFGKYGQPIS